MEWGWIAGAGGLVAAVAGAVVAFRKAGPESSQVLVDAAADVVIIQRGWIEKAEAKTAEAEKRLDEAIRRINELQSLEAQVAEMRQELEATRRELAAVRSENEKLRSENATLRGRVLHLENENKNGGDK